MTVRIQHFFVAGLLVGIPIGSVLGQWAMVVWLPLGLWATYQASKGIR